MNRDVSGNDIFDDHVDSSVDSSGDSSGSESPEVSSSSGKTVSENTENETESTLEGTTVYVANTYDYSPYFENITVLLIFISALLVAYGLAFAFFKGFKK